MRERKGEREGMRERKREGQRERGGKRRRERGKDREGMEKRENQGEKRREVGRERIFFKKKVFWINSKSFFYIRITQTWQKNVRKKTSCRKRAKGVMNFSENECHD
jgi:hypothetical protein